MFSLVFSSQAVAQHTDLVDSSQVQVLADTSKSYAIPDLTRKKAKWTDFSTRWITGHIGFAPILDYNAIIQDDESIQQVGNEESRLDLRSGRFSLSGRLLFKKQWSYMVSMEYKGFDRAPEDKNFGFTDIKLVIPVFWDLRWTVGKIKETFIYEMVGDAANLPHQERILNPFFKSRNWGFTLSRTFMKDRVTASAGWFNDFLISGEKFKESGSTFTARITGLPRYSPKGNEFLHVGLGYRYLEAEKGVLRLKGRNEVNIGANYVDTRDFSASNSHNFSFEQLWSLQNFSLLNEYVHTWAFTPEGTEQFNGIYVTASYIFSGESRPYDKKVAYARRVIPQGKWGAWETVFRVSRVNLTSRNIDGGILTKFTFGLNWWATQHWKVGMFYGVSNLKKDDILGVTNNFQWRIQWIY
jgi:phosphate-selective porin